MYTGCERPRETGTGGASAASMLALGDSYTIGEGVQEKERWPVILADRLREKGMSLAAPMIVARTGWTIDELQAAVDRAAPSGPFGLVTLLIGVNDQFRRREAEACRKPFRKLLKTAIALAGNEPSRVIVVSIPDWGVTPFAANADPGAIGAAIDRFNQMQQEEAGKAHARYQDITGISRVAKSNRSLLAGDQLHPSRAMYERWVEVLLAPALEVLRK
jgi:lysophospholipase L1-like esterase